MLLGPAKRRALDRYARHRAKHPHADQLTVEEYRKILESWPDKRIAAGGQPAAIKQEVARASGVPARTS
jgi:hypothetical protein